MHLLKKILDFLVNKTLFHDHTTINITNINNTKHNKLITLNLINMFTKKMQYFRPKYGPTIVKH